MHETMKTTDNPTEVRSNDLARVFRANAGRLVKLTIATFTALVLPTGGWSDSPGVVHYPDLQTWTPYEVRIERSGKTRLLRFSNTIANRGEGPLEIVPVNRPDGTTEAHQVLYTHDSEGNWLEIGSEFVGSFELHPTHNHWHFADFARYELRSVAADGSIGSRILTSRKVSFCVLDTTVDDPALEHSGPRTYLVCGRELPQGISVGWADTYGWWLPDQDLDISGIKNGNYWLVSTADPDDRLNEGGTREDNNSAAVKLQIRGNSVTVIQDGLFPAGSRR